MDKWWHEPCGARELLNSLRAPIPKPSKPGESAWLFVDLFGTCHAPTMLRGHGNPKAADVPAGNGE